MTLQKKSNKTKASPTGNPKSALEKMKTEVASELGLANYDAKDKGNLTSKQNGNVGGQMTKKLVEMGEQGLSNKRK